MHTLPTLGFSLEFLQEGVSSIKDDGNGNNSSHNSDI